MLLNIRFVSIFLGIKKSFPILLLTILFSSIVYSDNLLFVDSNQLNSLPDFGQRIINADEEPQNWLSTGRNYQETRFSPLSIINEKNVEKLGLEWSFDLDTNRGQEATPIVVDGVLYTSSAWSKVQAFDVLSGRLLWQFDPEVPKQTLAKGCCGPVNRGPAYWDGKVYIGTFDGRLIALDAKTGKQIWSTVTVDQSKNYTITGAPRIAKGLVIIGNGGSEFGVRGYVSAYDVNTGEQKWRFYTVPGEPGKPDGAASDVAFAQFAAKTWGGNWWKESGGYGGGTVWDSFAYDSELGLLYVGVGNGAFWDKSYRSPNDLDNLFIASILALRIETGEYVWHYQQTPGDAWDYTSTQHMILTDMEVNGKSRKVIMQAPKNGFFYVLDRVTGELLSAEPYVKLNWASGIDMETGRPKFNPDAFYWKTNKPWLTMPGSIGAHNWHPMSYSLETGLVYIPVQEIAGVYSTDKDFKPQKHRMNFGIESKYFMPPDDKATFDAVKHSLKGYLLAWNPKTQQEVWRAPHSTSWNGGVLSTAGNLVFQGDIDGGFNAYNARTGEKLWSFPTGSAISAAPISYAVNGRQYITIISGWGTSWAGSSGALGLKDGIPRINKSRVLTFALDGKSLLPSPEQTLKRELNPPLRFGTSEQIKAGEKVFHRSCFACHGTRAVASGAAPDLRYSKIVASKDAWNAVVIDGIFAKRGMISFKDTYSVQELENTRAYIVDRAYRKMAKQ